MHSPTPSHKADAMLAGVTLLAAVSWILSRNAVQLMPPLLFMSLRFLLAGALLALVGWRSLLTMTPGQLRACIVSGLVFALAMSLWVMGISSATHVGEGAFLTSLGVVAVPVMGSLFFGERQPLATWLAVPVAGAGLALLALRHGFHPERGQIFYTVSALIFAFSFHLNARALRPLAGLAGQVVPGVSALALTVVIVLAVGVVCGVLSLLIEPWQRVLPHFSLAMAGWVVASAVAGTAARFLLQLHAQSLAGTSGVIIMIMEPVWVALLAAACFGESMSGRQLAGCALIFLAILINRAAALRQWLASVF